MLFNSLRTCKNECMDTMGFFLTQFGMDQNFWFSGKKHHHLLPIDGGTLCGEYIFYIYVYIHI